MIIYVLILLILKEAVTEDPCLDFQTFRTREQALECARSVPFDKRLFNDIISGMVDNVGGDVPHINYQIYKDVNKDSGKPFFIEVDLFKKLNEIKGANFTNWFDAIYSVWSVWNSLKDVHTSYWVYNIFQYLTFFHPISILPVYDATTQKLTMTINNNPSVSLFFDAYNDLFSTSIDFTKYNGWVITGINEEDPLEFLKKFVDENVFFNRNPGANFNELVKQLPAASSYRYYLFDTHHMPIPKGPITYEVFDPKTGDAETLSNLDYISCFWKGTSCLNVKDTVDLTNQVFNNLPHDQNMMKTIPKFHLHEHTSLDVQTKKEIETQYKNGDWKVICKESHSNFFLLMRESHPETGFFQVVGEGNYARDGKDYAEDVIRCVKAMKEQGFTRLVLDLRFNGGGMPRLSYTIASAISKQTFPDPGVIQTPIVSTIDTYNEMRKDKFGHFAALVEVLHPQFFPNRTNQKMVMPDGETEVYSPLYNLNLTNYFSYPNLKSLTGFEGFEPEDLIVLSAGAAISAGGELFKFMQFTKSGKIALLGGYPDAPFDGSCVDAGLTTGINSVYKNSLNGSYLSILQLTLASVFPQRPTYSIFDKCYVDCSKFYELVDSIPTPDFRHFSYLDLGVAIYSDDLLQMLDEDFETCVDWNVKVNPSCDVLIEHGVYGNPCVSGKYDTKKCVMKRCGDGYFLNLEETECVEIEKAPIFRRWEDYC